MERTLIPIMKNLISFLFLAITSISYADTDNDELYEKALKKNQITKEDLIESGEGGIKA